VMVRRWILRYIAGDRGLRFKIWALLILHAWLDERRAESRRPRA